MNFANLSAPWVVAGLAGLAALLFVLQQLRTRYRDVTVVTTLFWKQVVHDAPVRKLRDRFRHPLAYALVLAICSLLWLAVAEPQLGRRTDETFHILVLDGSAGMAAGDRFADAVDALERQVARLPSDRRQVIWSGADIRPLLNPGEHALLLRARLERLSPQAAPASLERLLRQLSATSADGGSTSLTSILMFGDAPVRKQVLDLVPASMTVKRATATAPLVGNSGITALGVSDAASGAWDKVDVFVQVQGTGDRRAAPVVTAAAAAGVQIEVNGQAVLGNAIARVGQGYVVADVPAAGGLLTARVVEDRSGTDSLPLDNVASLRLPTRPILNVQLSSSLQSVLGPLLEADAGVTLVSEQADVVIRRKGESVGGNAPALEFVPAASQSQAFLLTHPDSLNSSAAFTNAVADIGLQQIDAMSLARSSGRPIEVSIASGSQWRFSVWEELLADEFDFTRSRAFPLFVANAVRWLADTEEWHPYVAAGRPLITSSTGRATEILNTGGRVLDPIGASIVPVAAGDLRVSGRAAPLSVSLLDADVTTGARDESLALATLAPVDLSPATGLVTVLLILALLLLAAEWYFFQMGRMP